MTRQFITIIFLAAVTSVTAVLFSCNTRNSPSAKLQIKLTGSVLARRSYIDAIEMKTEKERKAVLDQADASDPVILQTDKDSIAWRALIKAGIIDSTSFNEKKLNWQHADSIPFLCKIDHDINLKILIDTTTESRYLLRAISNADSSEIKTAIYPFPYDKLQYKIMDILPGGKKELILLSTYYIMNGYNFDIYVYEIKTNS